ncbi:MAG: hypothetical protein WD048_15915 [Chitinophagales bacterium]
MAKYIIFTNNNVGCFPDKNPFQIMGIPNFGSSTGIAVAGKSGGKLITKSVFTTDNYDFLFLSDLAVNEDYIPLIKSFAGNDQEAFVLLHSGVNEDTDITRKNQQKKALKKALGENFEWFIEQSHGSNSIYRNELIELAEIISSKPLDENKYNDVLKNLKLYWPNPHLESLIHLHKTLSIIKLKKNENPDFNDLKAKDEYKLAFLSWEKDKNGNDHEVDALLEWTSEQIPIYSIK